MKPATIVQTSTTIELNGMELSCICHGRYWPQWGGTYYDPPEPEEVEISSANVTIPGTLGSVRVDLDQLAETEYEKLEQAIIEAANQYHERD